MNPHSVAGLDGMSGTFYQSCWDIIKVDLLVAVQPFFYGSTMPRYMTHACLALPSKV